MGLWKTVSSTTQLFSGAMFIFQGVGVFRLSFEVVWMQPPDLQHVPSRRQVRLPATDTSRAADSRQAKSIRKFGRDQ